jgi:chitodextrinase
VTGYNVFRNGVMIGTVPGNQTYLVDFGLSAGTTYTYTVDAFNAAGGTSAMSTPFVVTTAGSTLSGPTAPTNLFSSATTTSDPVGVTGYNVFRNGVMIGTVPGNQTYLVDFGLTAGTTYTYTVNAFDAAGGISAMSTPFVVTTLAH